jgi:hypothetical protein
VPISDVPITAVPITAVAITAVAITAVAKTSAGFSKVHQVKHFLPGDFPDNMNFVGAALAVIIVGVNVTKCFHFCNLVVRVK